MFHPNCHPKRSRDLPLAVHDATQKFWEIPDAIKNPESVLFSEISLPYVIPNYRVVDVDTLEYLRRPELLYQANRLLNEQI